MSVIDRDWEQWVDENDIRAHVEPSVEDKEEANLLFADMDPERERIAMEIAIARERNERAGWPHRRTDWD